VTVEWGVPWAAPPRMQAAAQASEPERRQQYQHREGPPMAFLASTKVIEGTRMYST